MKNFSSILNVILLIAVGALYYFQFSSGKEKKPTNQTVEEPKKEFVIDTAKLNAGARIAYVNTDTIISKYQFYMDQASRIKAKKANAEYQLTEKMKELESNYKDLLTKVNLKLVTIDEAEQEFALKQEEVEKYRTAASEELYNEEQDLVLRLYDSISVHVKKYNDNSTINFTYILAYQEKGALLHADESFNMTDVILESMNTTYANRKKNQPKK